MASPEAPSQSKLKNALLVVGTVLFVVVLLAALEGVLRLVGVGSPDASQASRLKYQQIYLPILKEGRRPDGTPVYETADKRLPYQFILRDKPASSLRVFVFGESAVAGLGYSPNVTFARHLERLLRGAYPNRTVELLNLGVVALSSRQVKLLVEDSSKRFAPDVVVVYCGNNEFLEIHAEKYARANATFTSKTLELFSDTNLFRAFHNAIHGQPKAPSLAEQDFSHDDLRVTQDKIIGAIKMTDGEVARTIDEYETNIEALVKATSASKTPTLLLSVASNWEWRGRSDLPADWPKELLGHDAPSPRAQYEEAVSVLDKKLQDAAAPDRHELLYRRALANREIGKLDAARDDFRASMNADPHLRRALDAMNARVQAIAKRNGVPFLDMVDALASKADHGVVGFDQFYDYVHFTPKGAVLAGAAIFQELQRSHLVPSEGKRDPAKYVDEQLDALEHLGDDFLRVDDWLGIGLSHDRIHDRDLWKYDKMVKELEALVAREPKNQRALVYLGNASFFRIDGARDAARQYRAALEVGDSPDVRYNLEALLRERAP